MLIVCRCGSTGAVLFPSPVAKNQGQYVPEQCKHHERAQARSHASPRQFCDLGDHNVEIHCKAERQHSAGGQMNRLPRSWNAGAFSPW